MKKHILIYGVCGGLLIVLLKLIEYRFLVIERSLEIYGGLVALLFASVGIWLGLKLTKTKETVAMVPRPTGSNAVRGLPRSLLVRVTGRLSINVCIYLCSKAVEIRTNLRFNARFFHRQFAQDATGQYLKPTGAHWFRLIVGSAGGMSRMVRWPR